MGGGLDSGGGIFKGGKIRFVERLSVGFERRRVGMILKGFV